MGPCRLCCGDKFFDIKVLQFTKVQVNCGVMQQELADLYSQLNDVKFFDELERPIIRKNILARITDIKPKTTVQEKPRHQTTETQSQPKPSSNNRSSKQVLKNNNRRLHSTILDNSQANQILDWYTGSVTTWKSLYVGSKDGFQAAIFHQLCDNKGETLTVIKDDQGFIFGGYTTRSWTGTATYAEAIGSWLFAFKDSPIKMDLVTKEYAVCDTVQYGPTFGGGHDIRMFTFCCSVLIVRCL
jgi:hypothetical protein